MLKYIHTQRCLKQILGKYLECNSGKGKLEVQKQNLEVLPCEQVNTSFCCKSMYIDFDKIWAWHSSYIALYPHSWIGHAFMLICIKSPILFTTSLIFLLMYPTANILLIPFPRETDLSTGYYGFKPQNAYVFTRKIWSGFFFLLLFWVFFLGAFFFIAFPLNHLSSSLTSLTGILLVSLSKLNTLSLSANVHLQKVSMESDTSSLDVPSRTVIIKTTINLLISSAQ